MAEFSNDKNYLIDEDKQEIHQLNQNNFEENMFSIKDSQLTKSPMHNLGIDLKTSMKQRNLTNEEEAEEAYQNFFSVKEEKYSMDYSVGDMMAPNQNINKNISLQKSAFDPQIGNSASKEEPKKLVLAWRPDIKLNKKEEIPLRKENLLKETEFKSPMRKIKKTKEKKEIKRLKRIKRKDTEESKRNRNEWKIPLCTHCRIKQIKGSFKPCGHLLYCIDCAKYFGICPNCKKKINSILEINYA